MGDPPEDNGNPPEDESTLPISQLSPSCHGDRFDERLQRLEKVSDVAMYCTAQDPISDGKSIYGIMAVTRLSLSFSLGLMW